MQCSVRMALPNSMLFISGGDGGDPPEPIRGAMILSTPTCISVGCYPENDGNTEIILGPVSEVDPGDPPAFVGTLDMCHPEVVISTSEDEIILRKLVQNTRVGLQIWLSHPRWPEKVIIGLE